MSKLTGVLSEEIARDERFTCNRKRKKSSVNYNPIISYDIFVKIIVYFQNSMHTWILIALKLYKISTDPDLLLMKRGRY